MRTKILKNKENTYFMSTVRKFLFSLPSFKLLAHCCITFINRAFVRLAPTNLTVFYAYNEIHIVLEYKKKQKKGN